MCERSFADGAETTWRLDSSRVPIQANHTRHEIGCHNLILAYIEETRLFRDLTFFYELVQRRLEFSETTTPTVPVEDVYLSQASHDG